MLKIIPVVTRLKAEFFHDVLESKKGLLSNAWVGFELVGSRAGESRLRVVTLEG